MSLAPDWYQKEWKQFVDVDLSALNIAEPDDLLAPNTAEPEGNDDLLDVPVSSSSEEDDIVDGPNLEPSSNEEECVPAPYSRPSRFMQKCLEIPGVMHIIDNLLNDVHTAMPHWKQFHADLKILESFFVVRDRRRRFIWTCIKDTRYTYAEKHFEKFTASLYEGRWHETLVFCKAIQKTLPFLLRCWDESAFTNGVDILSKVAPDTAMDIEGTAGHEHAKKPFSPQAFTSVKELFASFQSCSNYD